MTIQGRFEAFVFYKLNLTCDESSPKQQNAHALGVLTFWIPESIDILTKIVEFGKLSKLCLFDFSSGQFLFEKLNSSFF